MNKAVIVLIFCFVAVGLIFGCTSAGTNTTNNTTNGGAATPSGNNSSNPVNGSGSGTIPSPPALPD
jgi:hypothetical protein